MKKLSIALSLLAFVSCSHRKVHPKYPIGSHVKIKYDNRSPVLNVYETNEANSWLYCEYTDSIGVVNFVIYDTSYVYPYNPQQ